MLGSILYCGAIQPLPINRVAGTDSIITAHMARGVVVVVVGGGGNKRGKRDERERERERSNGYCGACRNHFMELNYSCFNLHVAMYSTPYLRTVPKE